MKHKNLRSLAVLLAGLVVSACATLPKDFERTESHALTGTEDTSLGVAVTNWTRAHGGKSGFYPLPNGLDAFGARLALMDKAERSIDAQYFLLKNDSAGLVFAGKLIEAADRGVRVRLLLDDVFTTAKDQGLLLLDQHPNIEIRLFNPIARGGIEGIAFLRDFKRANRRMHNKSFTVDNQVTIVGGRNIAEEYFQLKTESEFIDFDILGFGPVAPAVAETFDRFWNHPLAMPVSALKIDTDPLPKIREAAYAELNTTGRSIYQRAIDAPLVQNMLTGQAEVFAADAEVITDDPDKLLNKVSREQQILITRMAEVVANAEREVVVATPYFIPGKQGLEFLKSVVDSGVRVTIVTNSLASTNHVAVHSAYSGYRKRLLRAGIHLYEMRANATTVDLTTGEKLDSLTLHTKAAGLDDRYLFVGSLNLDPRSIDINTEMGVLIDSPELSAPISERFKERLPEIAYKLELNEKGKIEWHATIDGQEVVETSEPLASLGRRFSAWLQKIVPESQL